MSFVKLDTGLIDSSLWLDVDASRVFIAAMCKAVPHEITKPTPTLAIRSLEDGGFVVPPGWYGLVAAASTGLIAKAHPLDHEAGLAALERLASPDPFSRSPEHDGRRLVRVAGGFLLLNYVPYRDRDHSAAERARRYRNRKRGAAEAEQDDDEVGDASAVTVTRHVTPSRATHADADRRSQIADADRRDPEGSGEGTSEPDAPILTHPTAAEPPRKRDRKPKDDAPTDLARFLFDEINAAREHIGRAKVRMKEPTAGMLRAWAYLWKHETPDADTISHVVDVRAAMDSRGEGYGELSWEHLCRPANWQRYRDREIGAWGSKR